MGNVNFLHNYNQNCRVWASTEESRHHVRWFLNRARKEAHRIDEFPKHLKVFMDTLNICSDCRI